MKNSVILKSFSSGISVIMDPEIPYEELLVEIAEKFKDADKFFKDAAVAVSLEGRNLTEKQEREILDIITQNSRIKVLCLMGKAEDKNIKFLGIQNNLSLQKDENYGQFYKGSLCDGQSIETERSIIILGDVGIGSRVYSLKDIVILGSLAGEVHAGAGGSVNHFIVALEMNPSALKIGPLSLEIQPEKASFWGRKPKSTPKIAYTCDGEVLMKSITKELLDDFYL